MKLKDQKRDCKWLVETHGNDNYSRSFRYKAQARVYQRQIARDKGIQSVIHDQYPGQY